MNLFHNSVLLNCFHMLTVAQTFLQTTFFKSTIPMNIQSHFPISHIFDLNLYFALNSFMLPIETKSHMLNFKAISKSALSTFYNISR